MSVALPLPGRRARRRALAPLAVVALGLTFGACGSDDSGSASTPTAPGAATTTATAATSVKDCGIDVSVRKAPSKIFAVYQPAIELAHALDLTDQLVGTAYIDNTILPEYAAQQKGTTYFKDIPSKEELLKRGADFVISGFPGVFTAEQYGSRASLSELGIDSWLVTTVCPRKDGEDQDKLGTPSVTIDTVYENLRGLGTVFGRKAAAEKTIAAMKAEVAGVQQAVAGAPKPSVAMVSYGKDGFGVYGTVDPADEIIKLAGGTNVFPELKGHYNPKVGVEEILKRNPDFILVEACCDTNLPSSGATKEVAAILKEKALANVPAVKNRHVYSIGFADVSGGVRLANSVSMVARWLHPDRVK
ncbi:hypothetical protein DSM112329_01950 [Paraconexibacter sp. AEG42_29]|uniref:Fe/B12 periplasmic-binding domain-containing protein n=1 Tax=Paraconexibacter sp. AEG42_29 TaxID=2997339 RepID=A0AAU7AUD6_9ACTN